MKIKHIILILASITFAAICFIPIYLVYLHSPWTPLSHNQSPKEAKLVSILSKRKDFADYVIQEYSSLPKDSTQEIRVLYEDAREKHNAIIALLDLGANSNSLQIDSISEQIPEAEKAYIKLYAYDQSFKGMRKRDRQQGYSQRAYDSLAAIDSSSELGGLLKAFTDIEGRREVYDRISKQINNYRWNLFPVK